MSRLGKNIIYNLCGQGILLVLGFVAVRYINRQLGEDTLGIIYFTALINTLLCAVLEMGICSTTVREVSAHFHSEPDYIRDLIRTGSLFYWGAYLLFSVVVFFLAPVLVEKWINLRTMDTETATYALRFLGIASLSALPRSFYVSLFRGLQRMELNNIIDVAITAIQQFGTILIIVLGGNLFHVVYWSVICCITIMLVYLAVSAHLFSLSALLPGYSFSVIRRNWKFASRLMSITILSSIYMQADKLIISKLLPITAVGYYGVAYSTASKGALLTGAISQAAFPSLSSLSKVGNRAGLISQYRKLQDLLCYGIVPIFAIIPFAALPLFSYIFNIHTAELLLLPTTLLCIGFYMNGTLTVPYVFSLAIGEPVIAVRLNFYALFVVLPVTAFLIYFFGLTGAGLSWVFYHIFVYAYGVPQLCRKCMKIPVWEWYLHILKIFVLTSLTYGLAWTTNYLIGNHSIYSLLIAYMAGSIVFLLGTYFTISDELKKAFSPYLNILNLEKLLRLYKCKAL